MGTVERRAPAADRDIISKAGHAYSCFRTVPRKPQRNYVGCGKRYLPFQTSKYNDRCKYSKHIELPSNTRSLNEMLVRSPDDRWCSSNSARLPVVPYDEK